MMPWLSIVLCLLLACGQVVLGGEASAASCACSQCIQIECCSCDASATSAPISVPIRSSAQLDASVVMQPVTTTSFLAPYSSGALLLTPQRFSFSSAVQIYQRNCAYLI